MDGVAAPNQRHGKGGHLGNAVDGKGFGRIPRAVADSVREHLDDAELRGADTGKLRHVTCDFAAVVAGIQPLADIVEYCLRAPAFPGRATFA